MRFRHKPVDVDALQWTGANAHELRLFVTRPNSTIGFNISATGGASVYCQAQEAWMTLPLRHWVVRTVHGHAYVMSDHSFAVHFDALAGHDAAAFDAAAETVACNHDWRVNPHLSLPTNPSTSPAVCLRCSATRLVQVKYLPPSADPLTWPKYSD